MTVDLDDDSEIGLASQEGLALIAKAEAIRVTDSASFQSAAEFLRSMSGHVTRIKDLFKPMKQSAQAAHRMVVEQESRMLEGPLEAVATVKRLMATFETERRREAMIAEARAAEEAKRQQAALPPGSAPVVVPPRAVEVPKASGVSFVERWSAVVTDKAKFLAAVAANPALHHLVEANQAGLNEMARAAKGQLEIPGVTAMSERSVSARALPSGGGRG